MAFCYIARHDYVMNASGERLLIDLVDLVELAINVIHREVLRQPLQMPVTRYNCVKH